MSDRVMTDEEVAQRFADQLDKLSKAYERPLPGARQRMMDILEDHEAECLRLEREAADAEQDQAAKTA